jgi:hypothetical protein
MIISHKYQFIFIKTHKTAGTSIEVFLSQFCDAHDILTPIKPPIENHFPRNYNGFFNPITEIVCARGQKWQTILRRFKNKRRFYNHIPAYAVQLRVPQSLWQKYFTFCVERNPWDKTVSDYYFCKNQKGQVSTLDDYFDRGIFCLNYPLYTDWRRQEKVVVDRIVQYEHLNDELTDVFKMLGIPFNGSLCVNAKGQYREDRRHYRKILTELQKDTVQTVFQKEIKLHNYKY